MHSTWGPRSPAARPPTSRPRRRVRARRSRAPSDSVWKLSWWRLQSEGEADARRHAGEIDLVESAEVRSEITLRPEVARVGGERDPRSERDVGARQPLHHRGRRARLEDRREHLVRLEVHEVAILMEAVLHHAAAHADPWRHSGRDPRRRPDVLTWCAEIELHVRGVRNAREGGALLD